MKKIFKLHGTISISGLKKAEKGLKNLERTVIKAVKPIQRFGKQVEGIGKTLTKNITAPLIAFTAVAYKATQAASDLGEASSKVGELFGESQKDIEAWAKTMDKTFGQSQVQALDAASNFAIFGKAAGKTGNELTSFSKDFTELASDMSSFFNTSPDEAITAIGAAFRGENEPIRKYGVLLNDATMRQKALELGIIDTVKNALTPQQKILAAQALIIEQTTAAQGDFARTSGDLANQTRILKAEATNLSAEFGKSFLPIALKIVEFIRTDFLPKIRSLARWFNNMSEETKETIIQYTALVGILGPLLIAIGYIIGSVKTLVTVFTAAKLAIVAFNGVIAASPIGLAIIAAAGLALGIKALTTRYSDITKEIRDTDKATKDLTVTQLMQNKADAQALLLNIKKKNANAIGLEDNKWFQSKIKAQEDEVNAYINKVDGQLVEARKQYQADYWKAYEEFARGRVQAEQKNNIAIIDEGEELLEAQEVFNEERLKNKETMLQELSRRVEQASLNEIELLEKEENRAIEKAIKLGATEEDLAEIRQSFLDLRIIAEKNAADQIFAEKEKEFDRLENLEIQKEKENDRRREREARKEKEKYRSITQFAIWSINSIFSLFSSSSDAKIAKLDSETEKQKANIEASTLSEEDKQRKFDEIDEKADAKKKELMLKQAKRDKASNLFAAGMGATQMAINGFNTQPFFPLGIIMGGIATAIGLAKVATIASAPLPQLAEGGTIRPSQGGTQVIVGEAGETETVLPMRKGAMEIADRIMNRVSAFVSPQAPQLAFAGGSGGGQSMTKQNVFNLHIGSLIADDHGLKELERRLLKLRVHEAQRKGETK